MSAKKTEIKKPEIKPKKVIAKKEVQKLENIIKKEILHKKPIEKIESPEIVYTQKEKTYYDLNYFYLGRIFRSIMYFFSYKHYTDWFNKTFNASKIELPKFDERILDDNEELFENLPDKEIIFRSDK
jgi:hypothetical protein